MSLTITVPAAVPSLVHSSPPVKSPSATKNSVPPLAIRRSGSLLPAGLMSLTSAAVTVAARALPGWAAIPVSAADSTSPQSAAVVKERRAPNRRA
jgi:hypothetical protein